MERAGYLCREVMHKYYARMDETTVGHGDLDLDTEGLTVLAHPLRSRLLSALRLGGPATATALAHRLGTNTGATSYHLRRLGEVGLVEDTGEGVGKRREWRAATRTHSYTHAAAAGDPDAEAAVGWLSRHYLQQMGERMGAWHDVEESWPLGWRDTFGLGDDKVVVTSEQAGRMLAEIADVVARYRAAGEGDPAAREALVWTAIAPTDLAPPA